MEADYLSRWHVLSEEKRLIQPDASLMMDL
jgi:hypothetical protein